MSAFRTPARRLAGGLSAGLAAAALVALSAGPGAAATVVAQATATAFEISIAGQSQDSGTYAVSNDGKTETSSGTNRPQATIPIPGASLGTLAQDATTRVVNRNGQSAACSGVAGDGATLIAVGDGACLTPGNDLVLGSGTLDLPALLAGGIPGGGVPGLPTIPGLPAGGVQQIQDAIDAALAALGDPSLALNAGAIQSACTATAPDGAVGDSQLTDVDLTASFLGTDYTLVDFPTSAPPNTKVLTDADDLVAAINAGIRTQLTNGLNGLNGVGGALAGLLNDTIIGTINDAVIAQLAPQLAPLEDNLLDGTINKQTRTPGAIDVTALDLQVLPAAQQFAGFSLVSAEIANVTCGPSGRVAPPTSGADPVTPGNPAVPTFVPAGEAGTAAPRTDDNGLNGVLAMSALGGLAVVSAGAGVAAYRKTSSR